MEQMALARKWRPRQFSDLVGQQHVVTALVNALSHNKLHHAYLLTGTRGVGKTTLARIFAKCLNCEQGVSATPCGECTSCQEVDAGRFVDLYEIDAASRTKVEDTRDLLDNVQYAPTKGRYKVYLIDEVHMLSGHSFNALLKTLEEPPEHVKFILATTDPEKLPATVLSRCLQFHLLALMPEQISQHCQYICQQENIESEAPALDLLAQAANGSMRDALSLLDQAIAYGNLRIDTNSMREMLGTIDPSHLYDLLDALVARDGDRCLSICAGLVSLGSDFAHVLADLLAALHQLTVMQQAPGVLQTDNEQLTALSQKLNAEDIQLFYQIGLVGQRDLALAPSSRIGFEMVILRMLAFYPNNTNAEPAVASKPQPAKQHTPTPTAPAVAPSANKATTPSNQSQPTRQSTQKPTVKPVAPANNGDQWTEWVAKMDVKAAALILAQNCSLAKYEGNTVELLLDPAQKPMLQKKYTDRINDSLNQLLNKDITLIITVSDGVGATPNTIAAGKREQSQQAAEQSIHSNPHVKSIVDTFDAEIISGSIVPNEKT